MKSLLLLLLGLALAACSPQDSAKNMLDQVARATPQELKVRATADAERLIASAGIPVRKPLKQIGYHSFDGAERRRMVVFESMPDPDGRVTVIALNYLEVDGAYRLRDFGIQPKSHSAQTIPPFSFADGSVSGWIALGMAICSFAVSVLATFLVVRTKGLKRKWLWIIGCLFPLGKIAVGWNSGEWVLQLGAPLLGAGVSALGGASEWVFTFGLPIFGLLFLWKRSRGRLQITDTSPESAS